MVESALHQYGRGSADLVTELCSEGRLSHVRIMSFTICAVKGYLHLCVFLFGDLQEFMQMLSRDISQRLKDEAGS